MAAAVLATGADEYKPTEYLYGEDERVLTLLELEDHIEKEEESLSSCPKPGDDSMCRLPARRPELLQPGVL